MRIIPFVGIVVIAVLCSAPDLSADAKSDWAKALKLRKATLKIDLPTIQPGGIGLLALSPDRGTFYRYAYLMDREPEQLLQKVRAEKAAGKSIRVWGWETGSAEPAELIYLRTGSSVTIQSVVIDGKEVIVWLWDEFAQQQKTLVRMPDRASSCVSIMLPEKLAKDFRERAQLDAMIATFLEFAPARQ